jgi:hypothetical protein
MLIDDFQMAVDMSRTRAPIPVDDLAGGANTLIPSGFGIRERNAFPIVEPICPIPKVEEISRHRSKTPRIIEGCAKRAPIAR